LEDEPTAERQHAKISERLHETTLMDLRLVLGKALASKQKVAFLLDNLDEPWRPHHDVSYLSDLLSGLLRVSVDIIHGFRRRDSRLLSVNTSIAIFIRSDIFYHLQHFTAEQDKLPVEFISWTDREMLLQVADLRLASALARNVVPETVWKELFTDTILGMPPREFIAAWSLPRPRHIINFLQHAISIAVNRGREIVTEADLFAARKAYSEFALRNAVAEDDPRRGNLGKILYEFAGVSPELPYTEVRSIIQAAGVVDLDIEFYVDLLCDLNFLGIVTRDGYALARDEGERTVLREVAKRVARQQGGLGAEESYWVNRAFHDVLQIR
jgi:hypothetical protein